MPYLRVRASAVSVFPLELTPSLMPLSLVFTKCRRLTLRVPSPHTANPRFELWLRSNHKLVVATLTVLLRFAAGFFVIFVLYHLYYCCCSRKFKGSVVAPAVSDRGKAKSD